MRRERVGSEGIVSDPFYKHIVCQGKVVLCVFSMCEKVNQREKERNTDCWIKSCVTCTLFAL